jgi:hypothetical protein
VSNFVYTPEDLNTSAQRPSNSRINGAKNPINIGEPGCRNEAEVYPIPLWYPANAEEGLVEFNIWSDVGIHLKSIEESNKFRNYMKWHYGKVGEILIGELASVAPQPYNYLAHQQIYYRTMRYNKFLEIIPRRHFLEGLSVDGDCINKGCGIKSKSNLTCVIQNLDELRINSHIPCFTVYGQRQRSKAYFAFDRTLCILVHNLLQWFGVKKESQGFLYERLLKDADRNLAREIIENLFSKEAFWCALETAWLDWCRNPKPKQSLSPLSLCGLPALVTDATPSSSVEYESAQVLSWLDSFSLGDNGTRYFMRNDDFLVRNAVDSFPYQR